MPTPDLIHSATVVATQIAPNDPVVMLTVLALLIDGTDPAKMEGMTEDDVREVYTNGLSEGLEFSAMHFADEHCGRCGHSLGDGEGFDGLCGSCADVAEARGEWD